MTLPRSSAICFIGVIITPSIDDSVIQLLCA
jgi:hypothetical protein